MEIQNYKNHIRYYTAHHFVFYPVVIFLFLTCISCAIFCDNKAIWTMIAIVWFMIGALSFMMRQHYALINQNRTVRLELRFRYYVLTHQRLELIENKLSLSQLYALRFASDEELVSLVDKTLKENLSADQIKRSIKNWLPDLMRV